MIELNHIIKVYTLGDNEIRAVDDVSFAIKTGEMVAIMGTSGSGKTTLMNIIGLLDQPTSGQYFLNDKEVHSLNPDERAYLRNREIGFIFQLFFLLPRLTALQNVCLPLIYRGLEKKQQQKLARAALEKVGMGNFVSHKPNELSGGQQQRVAIARALVSDPNIILADEPTGSLDSKTGQDVMNLLMEINRQEKATIVVVTHDQHVGQQCQRVIRLKDGKLV